MCVRVRDVCEGERCGGGGGLAWCTAKRMQSFIVRAFSKYYKLSYFPVMNFPVMNYLLVSVTLIWHVLKHNASHISVCIYTKESWSSHHAH